MIVRQLQEVEKTDRCVKSDNWKSVRMSLKNDNMGFSFHITTIYAGTETPIPYQNPLETDYCISGYGEVETVEDGKIYPISPGTIYILDKHDKHLLRAHEGEDIVFACAFNPPLNGKEVHDENGVYPLEAEEVAE